MRTYILQKDLPNVKKGAKFVNDGERYVLHYPNGKATALTNNLKIDISYSKEEVENNADFFALHQVQHRYEMIGKDPSITIPELAEQPFLSVKIVNDNSDRDILMEKNQDQIHHLTKRIDGEIIKQALISFNLKSKEDCEKAIEVLSILILAMNSNNKWYEQLKFLKVHSLFDNESDSTKAEGRSY